jgi:ABC-2 type transport system permease protein
VTRLLEAISVDPIQWRILVRTFLKIDFGGLRSIGESKTARRNAGALFLTAIIYFLSGFAPAMIIAGVRDLFLGATVMTTVIAFMVLSSLVVGDGLSIVSPDDHAILGFRPVTSRTYLAVRLTTLFVRTVAIVTLVSVLPVAALFAKDGLHPVRALGGLLAAHGTGAAVTLGFVAVYGWLLRTVGPARVLRVLSYLQFAVNMTVWLSFILVSQGLQRRVFSGTQLSEAPWVLAYPGAWFASIVQLAGGNFGAIPIAGTSLAVVLLALILFAIGGKLSLDYAAALGRLTTTAAVQPVKVRPSLWLGLLHRETRAVAILVRSQFKNDIKFRLGLISLLPITLIYLMMGLRSESMGDPFVPGTHRGNEIGFLQIALMFLPMTMRQAIVMSDGYRASWLFYATPADRTRLVLAARDVITVFFLVPYLAFLAAIFTYFFGNVLHAVVHAFFLGFMSYLVLQFTIMIDPKLPFSTPPQKDTRGGMTFWIQLLVMFLGMAAYLLLTYVVYRSLVRLIVAVIVLVMAAKIMGQVTRARVERRAEGLAYLE